MFLLDGGVLPHQRRGRLGHLRRLRGRIITNRNPWLPGAKRLTAHLVDATAIRWSPCAWNFARIRSLAHGLLLATTFQITRRARNLSAGSVPTRASRPNS